MSNIKCANIHDYSECRNGYLPYCDVTELYETRFKD